jgi:hypothetical protein
MDNPQTTTDDADDAGEYAALRSYDLLAAYIYKKHGADSVRTLFHQIGGFACEDFEQAIETLEQRGLSEVAQVMQEIAAEYPSGRTLNPYPRSSWCNWLQWDRSWFNRRRIITGEVERSLRARKRHRQRQAPHLRH